LFNVRTANCCDMPRVKRKVRGIEAAGWVLVLVIIVAVALALWYAVSGMLSSAAAPNIQIDAYNSTIVGGQVWLTLKFGTPAQNPRVTIYNPDGTPTGCTASVTRSVSAGESVFFKMTCTLQRGRPYIVVVTYQAGGKTYSQTLNWQT